MQSELRNGYATVSLLQNSSSIEDFGDPDLLEFESSQVVLTCNIRS